MSRLLEGDELRGEEASVDLRERGIECWRWIMDGEAGELELSLGERTLSLRRAGLARSPPTVLGMVGLTLLLAGLFFLRTRREADATGEVKADGFSTWVVIMSPLSEMTMMSEIELDNRAERVDTTEAPGERDDPSSSSLSDERPEVSELAERDDRWINEPVRTRLDPDVPGVRVVGERLTRRLERRARGTETSGMFFLFPSPSPLSPLERFELDSDCMRSVK